MKKTPVYPPTSTAWLYVSLILVVAATIVLAAAMNARPERISSAPASATHIHAVAAGITCTTDSDCQRKLGGNGDPTPAR